MAKRTQKSLKREQQRGRLMSLDLYPDNENHLEVLEFIKSDYNFVGMYHDRDTYLEDVIEDDVVIHNKGDMKKSHYHIILKFENARSISGLSSELGIESNLIQRVSSFRAYAIYLTHRDEPLKAQYAPGEFFGSLSEEAKRVQAPDDVSSAYITIRSYIDSYNGYLEYDTFVDFVFKAGYIGYFMRNSYVYDQLRCVHNKRYYESKHNMR